ncbi:dynactin p62 family-domain-containing protein [Phascolomyces articulosus]|uniref:Dynactin subunit 4 n=1 Tax=Phascolomyces articulosus TaxID=60185 RepID=A0AAD5JL29_9FUNG|nr:dynactin p62 family-domain-containing protein [Phascolomyces articulosus]
MSTAVGPPPFVHYYCACPDLSNNTQDPRRSPEITSKKDTESLDEKTTTTPTTSTTSQTSQSTQHQQQQKDQANIDASATGRHLLSTQASNYLYPLSRLYFCEDCHQIRCPSCVQDEIVSYYCPNCLFEVPTASVKSEKNRCARNCFQCPICQNTLSVVAAQEATPSSTPASAGPYFLSCNVCRWNSKEIDMTFEKPTSLALQLQKTEETLPDAKEFDNLKDHLEKHLRLNVPPTLPTSFLSFSSSGAFSKMMGSHLHQDNQSQQGKLDDLGAYEPAVHVPDDDSKLVDQLMSLRSVDQVSTLSQRFSQLHDQPYQLSHIHPQRIHLCIKRSKRCRTCRHILIKPEQKAQATRFKIKLVAMNYIPNISIVKLPRKTWPLQQGIPTQFVLKFTNPLYEEMNITLATPQMQKKAGLANTNDNEQQQPPLPQEYEAQIRGKVTLLSPHFTVGAYNETIEYDDEMYPTGSNMRGRSAFGGGGSGGLSSSWVNGVHEKRNNYTSIIVEVIPEQMGEFQFPLLVTYNYKSDEDRMDVSSGDIDEEDIEDVDADDGSRKANSSMRLDDDRIKSYSFWCLIGLGQVTRAESI